MASSMNAMLKAQMLATALDVYFSGNEGDPIGSISLGGVNINLTNIGGANGQWRLQTLRLRVSQYDAERRFGPRDYSDGIQHAGEPLVRSDEVGPRRSRGEF